MSALGLELTSEGSGKNSPKERRESFAKELYGKGIEGTVISDARNIFYFTGFFPHVARFTSLLFVTNLKGSFLFLGESQASNAGRVFDDEVVTFRDYDINERMVAYAGYIAREFSRFMSAQQVVGSCKAIGVDDWHIPHVYSHAISNTFPGANLTGVSHLILSLRKTKGTDELTSLREATRRMERGYSVARDNIRLGKSELELCRDVMSDSIVTCGPFEFTRGDTWISGERTLEMSGPPTTRMLKEGDSIILDLQALYNNYWADGARTYVLGKPSQKQERIFSILLEAKKKAERRLKPGTTGKEIYKIVFDEIANAGYSDLFPHHAGHGLGLEDQEPPFFIPSSNEPLEEGVVCTIEPGIYHPQIGGFRDEDTYIITRDGFEKITKPVVALR